MTLSTSASVAIVVSPGVVIASAPCAAPHSTAQAAFNTAVYAVAAFVAKEKPVFEGR